MAETKELDDRTYNLLFSIRRSVRYHQRRRRFYENWNSLTVAVAAIGSSAAATAFATGVGWSGFPVIISGLVAFLSAFDLAVGTARSGDSHAELARSFNSLEQRFAHGNDLTDPELEELTKERLKIEASEPTTLRLLDILCHFELLRATGDERSYPTIRWWRRKLAHWLSQDDYVQQYWETWKGVKDT